MPDAAESAAEIVGKPAIGSVVFLKDGTRSASYHSLTAVKDPQQNQNEANTAQHARSGKCRSACSCTMGMFGRICGWRRMPEDDQSCNMPYMPSEEFQRSYGYLESVKRTTIAKNRKDKDQGIGVREESIDLTEITPDNFKAIDLTFDDGAHENNAIGVPSVRPTASGNDKDYAKQDAHTEAHTNVDAEMNKV